MSGESSLNIARSARMALEKLREETIESLLKACIGGGLSKRDEKAARKEMALQVLSWQEHISTLDKALTKARMTVSRLSASSGENNRFNRKY